MRYVGGKARIAKWIRNHVIDVADEYRGMELTYVEPFVGSAAVLTEVVRKSRGRFSRFVANDIQPDLIRMWSALMDGWIPPEYVSREEHKELKNSKVPSALRGYAGFCCSFGGNFFSGHESREGTIRDGSPPRGSQTTERRTVARTGRILRRAGVKLQNTDYAELQLPPGSIVYCDPPYIGTTGYDCGDFDHDRFWKTMTRWVESGAIVFVSEYEGPPDWPVVDEHPRLSVLGTGTGQRNDRRNEKLFMRRPGRA